MNDKLRFELLKTLVAQGKVELWIWSPTEQLNVRVTEDNDIEYFMNHFDAVVKDNVDND